MGSFSQSKQIQRCPTDPQADEEELGDELKTQREIIQRLQITCDTVLLL